MTPAYCQWLLKDCGFLHKLELSYRDKYTPPPSTEYCSWVLNESYTEEQLHNIGGLTDVTCDLTSWPWHSLDHRWQVCKISGSKKAVNFLSPDMLLVKSYGLDTICFCMCTMTRTLEIRLLVNVMTNPWVLDNNCMNYHQNPNYQWKVMAWTPNLAMCALWPWPCIYCIQL